MENLIKKIRAVEPTKEQLRDRTPEYAFGWVDSLNAITEVVKNNVDLHNVSNRRELFDDFYGWLDGLTQEEYDDMSLTEKIEKYFFKN